MNVGVTVRKGVDPRGRVGDRIATTLSPPVTPARVLTPQSLGLVLLLGPHLKTPVRCPNVHVLLLCDIMAVQKEIMR